MDLSISFWVAVACRYYVGDEVALHPAPTKGQRATLPPVEPVRDGLVSAGGLSHSQSPLDSVEDKDTNLFSTTYGYRRSRGTL